MHDRAIRDGGISVSNVPQACISRRRCNLKLASRSKLLIYIYTSEYAIGSRRASVRPCPLILPSSSRPAPHLAAAAAAITAAVVDCVTSWEIVNIEDYSKVRNVGTHPLSEPLRLH